MVKKELVQCFDFDAEGAPIEMKNEHSYDLRKIEMTKRRPIGVKNSKDTCNYLQILL